MIGKHLATKIIMDCSLTLFKNIYDNKTHQRLDFDNFQSFENVLYKLSERPIASKKDAPLMSPAVYQPDTTRKNDNVIEWAGWAAVDVDEHKFEGDLQNELTRLYGRYYYVCYSTASSTVDHPKFRLVFPLAKSVERDRIKKFWYALQTELGSIGDRQTKDLSRMYYVPGQYAGAHNFIFSNSNGSYLYPDELIKKHPMLEKKSGATFFDRLPAEIQEQIVAHRKNQADNVNITWNSYRDCPFVNKRLIEEYKSINETGWYHGLYRIMVSIAGNAVKQNYPITAKEIAVLCQEIDNETGQWYDNRPLEKEADRAIEFVYQNA